jgi:hypothetical protein
MHSRETVNGYVFAGGLRVNHPPEMARSES